MSLRTAVKVAAYSGILLASSAARAQGAPVGEPDGGTSSPPRSERDEPEAPVRENDPVRPAPVEPEPSPAQPTAAPVAVLPDDEIDKGKKRKGRKKGQGAKNEEGPPAEDHGRFGAVEFKARLYVRAEYDHRDEIVLNDMLVPTPGTVDSLDLSVPKAHVSAHYQAPFEWLSAVIEVDVAGKPHLRDAYIQARDSHFLVRGGQFKLPVASVDTASPWSLPLVRRGLIHDVLVDRLDYGGRRPGLLVGWHGHSSLHPKVVVGAFQGKALAEDPTPIERDTDLIANRTLDSQSVVARAQIEHAGAEVGLYYENRIGAPSTLETNRYWTAGADLYYDHVFENGGFRAWVDGVAGASWYELANKPADGKDAVFVAVRALAAYRFGGTTEEAFYVEPYVSGGGIDPDAEVTHDLLWEGVVGINVGYWRRMRLTMQGEVNKGQRNFPSGYFAGLPPDRIGLILQAGVAF